MFLVIEGIDASGKKTQVDLLREKLVSMGNTVKIIDFPRYDKDSSYFVRKYLAGKYGKKVNAEISSLLFAMDRFDASFQLKKDLQNYDYVIANRYVSSSMIHHGCKMSDNKKRGEFISWLENIEYNICCIPKPDAIFFLSLSFENNLKLIQKRAFQTGETQLDLHEGDNEYLKKAWKTAHDISGELGWIKIECESDNQLLKREEITQLILTHLL